MNVTGLHWWPVNIGSGNGLLPSGNKPLPEPMVTQIFVARKGMSFVYLHHSIVVSCSIYDFGVIRYLIYLAYFLFFSYLIVYINSHSDYTLQNCYFVMGMRLVTTSWFLIKPLCAKFFRWNKNICLHFMSFLHIDMTHVVEILPQVRQELTCSM